MPTTISDGIKIPKEILKTTGHWPEEAPTVSFRIRGFLSFSMTVIFVATMAMELVTHIHNYDVISELLALITPTGSFLIKLIIFKKGKKPLLELLQRLNLGMFNNHPKHLYLIMEKSVRTSVLVGTLYQGICCIVVLLYCVIPLVTKADMLVRFSYDLGSFKNLMYLFQVIALVNAALLNSCLDVLATSLMGVAAAQIDILNQRIIDFNQSSGQEDVSMDNLRQCVKHHNEIIRYIENLEGVFSMIFLVQYLASGVVICNIGLQLVIQTVSIQFANMIFFFNAMMCQLGMYCWFGNEIIVKSTATKYACFKSDWTNCNLKIRKTLIIITERSKKPLFLTAGKFSILSLASFATVINTSYSYFALMQRLYSKSQQ